MYAFARTRVTLCKDGLPERTVWLVIKCTVGVKKTYAYYISNAPVRTPLRTFVWGSGLRWTMEQCFEEAKTELGMDQYEVRKYPGRQHHMLTAMLAHFFSVACEAPLGEKSPCTDRVTAPELAGSGLTVADLYA